METGRGRETERFLCVRGASVSTGFIFAPRKGQGPLLPLPCIPANSSLPAPRPFSLLSIRIPSIGVVDVSSTSGETPGGCYGEPSGLIPAPQQSLLLDSVLKDLCRPVCSHNMILLPVEEVYIFMKYSTIMRFRYNYEIRGAMRWSVCIFVGHINSRRKCTDDQSQWKQIWPEAEREESRKIAAREWSSRRREKERQKTRDIGV
mgnify:CR=1 FL=1